MTTFSDENSPATITLGSDVAGDFFFSKYPCLNLAQPYPKRHKKVRAKPEFGRGLCDFLHSMALLLMLAQGS